MTKLQDGAKGIKWISFSRLLRQGIQFLTLLILATLLEPKDFGLMGIALIVLNFLNTIRDFGMGSALIQKTEVSNKLISTAFYLNIGASVILTILTIILAPLIATLLSDEQQSLPIIIKIIRVLAVVFLIASVALVQQSMLEKGLKFRNIAIYEAFATFIGAVASIIIALNGGGVWSLVYQTLIISFIITTSVITLMGLPSIKEFNIHEIRSIYKFSINLLGFNLVNYFVRNADYILIGKFLGTTQLGYYSLAYRIMLYPIQNITNIISRVMLPIYSKLQENLIRFRDVFKKVSFVISGITFPLMFGIAVLSTDFVDLFLGEKWEIVGILLIFIAPVGAMQSIATTSGTIYQALGRTDIMFKWGLFTGFAFILSFMIGLKWGILGVSIAYLIVNLIIFYPWLKIPFRLIDLRMGDFFKFLRSIIFSSIIMVGFLFLWRNLSFIPTNNTYFLILSAIMGGVLFYSLLFAFDKRLLMNIFKQIKS